MINDNKPKPTTLPLGPMLKEGGLDLEIIKEVVTENVKQEYRYATEELVVDDMNYVPGLAEKVAGSFWGAIGYSSQLSVSENYGVKFKSAQKSLENFEIDSNELNILFMGTGGTLHFGGKHKDVYEGGDVLCHLGLHKGIENITPTLLLRGVGTANFDSATEFYEEVGRNKSTAGSANEGIQGTGVKTRLAIAMEQFYIPTLLMMVNKKIKQGKVGKDCELTFNIVGHSRGAITSYAMADLIDVFMKDIEKLNEKDLAALADNISVHFEKAIMSKESGAKKTFEKSLSKEEILASLIAIRNKDIHFRSKIMIYDPVEGRAGFGDYYTSSFTFPIYGKPYTCSYSGIPESVKEAQIFVAYDERRIDFQPTIAAPDNNQETNLRVIPVLGVHGTLKGYFSVFNDVGQDSYASQKNSTFLKEALRASADLIKVKSSKFLFDKLPAFDTITLYNAMYSNDGKGYPRTKKRLLVEIEKWIQNPNKEFVEKLSQLAGNVGVDSIKEKGLGEVLTHQQLISLCTWVMNKNPELSGKLYQDLERDVYSEFLRPESNKKAKLLRALRNEMRNDVWNVGIDMKNQSSDDCRYIWHRDKQTRATSSTMDDSYPELAYNPVSSMWYPQSQGIGRSVEDYIHDPFYFNLFDFINSEDEQHLSMEEYDDLDLIAFEFAKLNELGNLYAFNKNEKSLVEYQKKRDQFLNTAGLYNIPDELTIKIVSFLQCKEDFQFRIPAKNRFSKFKMGGGSADQMDEVIACSLAYQVDTALKLFNDKYNEDYIPLYFEINKLHKQILTTYNIIPDDVMLKLEELFKLNEKFGQAKIVDFLSVELSLLNGALDDRKTKSILVEEAIIYNHNAIIEELKKPRKIVNANATANVKAESVEELIAKQIKAIQAAKMNIIEIDKIHKEYSNEILGLQKKLTQAKTIDSLNNIYIEVNELGKRDSSMESSHFINAFKSKISEEQKRRVKKYQYANSDRYRSLKTKKTMTHSFDLTSQKENIKPIDIAKVNELVTLINNYKKDEKVLQILLDAVKEENVKTVSEYLDASKKTGKFGTGFDISLSSQRDPEGNSALHLIAKSGNLELWELVMNAGYKSGYTSLTTYKPEDIFKNFSTLNAAGETPLDIAIKSGNVEVVKKMRTIYHRIDPKKYNDKVYDAFELTTSFNIPKSKKSKALK